MKQINVWWSKLVVNNAIQLCVLIIDIFAIYFAARSFNSYGWEYVIDPQYILPEIDRSVRMFMVFFTVIYVFQVMYNMHLCAKFKNTSRQWILFSGGIFTCLLTPYLIYSAIHNGDFKDFKTYLASERQEGLQISHLHVWNSIKHHDRKDKLFGNTILAYFVFLCTLVGFIVILIPKNNYSGLSFLSFEVFTYFTQWSNILCFVFMTAFLCFHKKLVFRQNTLLSYLATYILIVGLVFWAVLLPFYQKTHDILVQPFRVFTHIWLHTITPIVIVIFAIRCYYINYTMPQKEVSAYCLKGCIIPAAFSIYAYLIPFTMHYSVYGPLTNLNTQMLNDAGKHMGYWWIIFVAMFAALLFVGVLFVFWWINHNVAKNHQSLTNCLTNEHSYSKITSDSKTK